MSNLIIMSPYNRKKQMEELEEEIEELQSKKYNLELELESENDDELDFEDRENFDSYNIRSEIFVYSLTKKQETKQEIIAYFNSKYYETIGGDVFAEIQAKELGILVC